MASNFNSFICFFVVFVVLSVSQISTAQNAEYCEDGAPVFGPGDGCSGCSERCMGYYYRDYRGFYCHTNLEKIDYCICCIPYPPDDDQPFDEVPTLPPKEAPTPMEAPIMAPTPVEAYEPLKPTPSPAAAPFNAELTPQTPPCVHPVAPTQIAPTVSPAAEPMPPQTSRRLKKKKHPKFNHVAPSVAPATSQVSTKSKKPNRKKLHKTKAVSPDVEHEAPQASYAGKLRKVKDPKTNY
ncbi:lysine-rich arabinogalactan protein 19-like [Papaver somniferum]|uniref:lysine-rich arabinogalactan protein 19-like n=1 Tax=Papaver somniferum TaxID=3469 RepID=UPI000E6F9F23|nr:lysine-rich arabinogalactan protein 19-like [Papaver somniferum]